MKKTPNKKSIEGAVVLDPHYEIREYWYALAAAILNPNLNSAEHAIKAMQIHRQQSLN